MSAKLTASKSTNPLIDQFVIYLRSHHYAANTVLSYTKDVLALDSYLRQNDSDFKNAQLDHLRGWLASGCRAAKDINKRKPVKALTIKRRVYAIRSFFRWLRSAGHRQNDPSLRLITPKTPRHLPKFLTVEQANRLADHPTQNNWFRDRNRALIELLYATGIRVSEAHMLDIEDINLNERSARVIGKGNKERMVFFNSPTAQALRQYLVHLNTTGPLFRNMLGNRISPRGIRMICRKSGIQNGIFGLHPHMLRHSCATHMLIGKMKLPSIQKLLGHTSLAATEKYLHTANDAFRALQSKHPLALQSAQTQRPTTLPTREKK